MNIPGTLIEKLDRLPPCVCRLLARSGRRLLSNVDLMKATGWGHSKLKRVSHSSTWRHITVEEVDVYLKACGMRWGSQRRQRASIRHAGNDLTKMKHLRGTGLAGLKVYRIAELLKRTEKLLMQ